MAKKEKQDQEEVRKEPCVGVGARSRGRETGVRSGGR